MKKTPEQKVEISIGVVCIPRNDQLAAELIHKLAVNAAQELPAKQRRELLNYLAEWLKQRATIGAHEEPDHPPPRRRRKDHDGAAQESSGA